MISNRVYIYISILILIYAAIPGQPAFSDSPRFHREIIIDTTNDPQDWIVTSSTKHECLNYTVPFADIAAVSYSSNGTTLNATAWLSNTKNMEEEFYNQPKQRSLIYTMVIDLLSVQGTLLDFKEEMIGDVDHKNWLQRISELASSGVGNQKIISENKQNFSDFHGEGYVNFSVDLGKMNFPDKYLVIFLMQSTIMLDDGTECKKVDFTEMPIYVPPERFTLKSSSDYVQLRAGAETEVVLTLNSSVHVPSEVVLELENINKNLSVTFSESGKSTDKIIIGPEGISSSVLKIKALEESKGIFPVKVNVKQTYLTQRYGLQPLVPTNGTTTDSQAFDSFQGNRSDEIRALKTGVSARSTNDTTAANQTGNLSGNQTSGTFQGNRSDEIRALKTGVPARSTNDTTAANQTGNLSGNQSFATYLGNINDQIRELETGVSAKSTNDTTAANQTGNLSGNQTSGTFQGNRSDEIRALKTGVPARSTNDTTAANQTGNLSGNQTSGTFQGNINDQIRELETGVSAKSTNDTTAANQTGNQSGNQTSGTFQGTLLGVETQRELERGVTLAGMEGATVFLPTNETQDTIGSDSPLSFDKTITVSILPSLSPNEIFTEFWRVYGPLIGLIGGGLGLRFLLGYSIERKRKWVTDTQIFSPN